MPFDYRLVSGSGDIKLTKDGNVLLHEMVCLVCDMLFVVLHKWCFQKTGNV